MMKTIPLFLLIPLIWVAAGCTGAAATASLAPPRVQSPTPSATPGERATATALLTPTASPAPSATTTATETATATAPTARSITLYYEEYAQIELISPAGTRVLIDVADPTALSQPPGEKDVLLVTHGHWDHYNQDFVENFPGPRLIMQARTLEVADVLIAGIPSAHNAGDALKSEGGTNYIYLIEMAGLRIVHFGDIGQDQLTPEQLAALGRVDVAITQLANPYSEMDSHNLKGFRLMEQVQPRLLIPTHADAATLAHALGLWPGFYAASAGVEISAERLSDHTQILLVGAKASEYPLEFDLPEW